MIDRCVVCDERCSQNEGDFAVLFVGELVPVCGWLHQQEFLRMLWPRAARGVTLGPTFEGTPPDDDRPPDQEPHAATGG